MDFRFNLNEIFREPVVEIGNTLIPPKFTGDKRALWDTQSKIAQIVNAMGEASAAAQGLSKAITTADRLRNSEHKLYLLIDQSANDGKGSVTGMLKIGEKGLYVFDREGQHYQVSPPCILDFYVHESKQRAGYGRRLFEHMLAKEQIQPVKMAIDRPSEKLLGFLNKHYGLHSPVKQMNNYVVFDEFFPRAEDNSRTPVDPDKCSPTKNQSANGLQQGGFPFSPYGRYGARKPPCSMNQIIHNDSAVIKRNQEPAGVRSEPVTNLQAQQNYQYSIQYPWQTTQSVPNMPMQNQPQYVYHQNQPQYNQNYVLAQGDAPPNPQLDYYYPLQTQQYYASLTEPPKAEKTREPILPQSFDGTVRKAPHVAQSMPVYTGQQNQPVLIHNTPSAPVSYQQPIYNVLQGGEPAQQGGEVYLQQSGNLNVERFHQNTVQNQQQPTNAQEYKQDIPANSAGTYDTQTLAMQGVPNQNQVPMQRVPSQNIQHNLPDSSTQNYTNISTPDALNQRTLQPLATESRDRNQEHINNQQMLNSQRQIEEQNFIQNTSPVERTNSLSMGNQQNVPQAQHVTVKTVLPHENMQRIEPTDQNQPGAVQNMTPSMPILTPSQPGQLMAPNQPMQIMTPSQPVPIMITPSQPIPCQPMSYQPIQIPSSANRYHEIPLPTSVQPGVHPSLQQNIFSSGNLNKPVADNQNDRAGAMTMQTPSIPNVNNIAGGGESCQPPEPKQYDLSKGYPPQTHQSPVVASTPIIIRN